MGCVECNRPLSLRSIGLVIQMAKQRREKGTGSIYFRKALKKWEAKYFPPGSRNQKPA